MRWANLPFGQLLLGLFGPQALGRAPDETEKSRVGLLELSPGGDVSLEDVDVCPVSQSMNRGIVKLDIENGSSVILDGILDGRDSDDEDQGNRVEAWVDAAKDGEDLYDG